ncbi:hypothetical protein [Shewanella sp.]|uniref:hypothetical protein n=1 Tax=Shewanella sp. TaxID=50422 RepID=UPI003A8642FC
METQTQAAIDDAAAQISPEQAAWDEEEFRGRQWLLRLAGSPLQQQVCRAASDYYYAVQDPEFAEMYGGVERFKREMFALVDQWYSALNEEALNE